MSEWLFYFTKALVKRALFTAVHWAHYAWTSGFSINFRGQALDKTVLSKEVSKKQYDL